MPDLLPLSQFPMFSQVLSRREAIALALKLVGGAASASVVNAFAAGDPIQTPPLRDVFPGDTRAIMAALTDYVIPRTDTPGALDAGVPAFVESIVANWYSEGERKSFIDGLNAIDAWCEAHHGKPFLQCDETMQVAALTEASRQVKAGGMNSLHTEERGGKPAETAFFTQLRELTTFGYCSSEIVSTQVFRYLPIPGHYDGHYPAEKVGTNWSY